MVKFDYMNFGIGGYGTGFDANANKYTEEQAIYLCVIEDEWRV